MGRQEDRDNKLAKGRGRIAPVQLAHSVRRTSRFDAPPRLPASCF